MLSVLTKYIITLYSCIVSRAYTLPLVVKVEDLLISGSQAMHVLLLNSTSEALTSKFHMA